MSGTATKDARARIVRPAGNKAVRSSYAGFVVGFCWSLLLLGTGCGGFQFDDDPPSGGDTTVPGVDLDGGTGGFATDGSSGGSAPSGVADDTDGTASETETGASSDGPCASIDQRCDGAVPCCAGSYCGASRLCETARPCADDSDCKAYGPGWLCDDRFGHCQDAGQCGKLLCPGRIKCCEGLVCNNGSCELPSPCGGRCKPDEVCDGATGRCQQNCRQFPCVNFEICDQATGLCQACVPMCGVGTCGDDGCGGTCHCAVDQICDRAGRCVRRPECQSDRDCFNQNFVTRCSVALGFVCVGCITDNDCDRGFETCNTTHWACEKLAVPVCYGRWCYADFECCPGLRCVGSELTDFGEPYSLGQCYEPCDAAVGTCPVAAQACIEAAAYNQQSVDVCCDAATDPFCAPLTASTGGTP